eukprot:758244-Pleurochrysis_carterae.AAC.3
MLSRLGFCRPKRRCRPPPNPLKFLEPPHGCRRSIRPILLDTQADVACSPRKLGRALADARAKLRLIVFG